MKAHFTLSKSPGEKWTFSTGRINDEMMKAHLPDPEMPDALVLICGMVVVSLGSMNFANLPLGPDALIKQTVKPGLERLGWNTSKTLVVF